MARYGAGRLGVRRLARGGLVGGYVYVRHGGEATVLLEALAPWLTSRVLSDSENCAIGTRGYASVSSTQQKISNKLKIGQTDCLWWHRKEL